MSANHDNIFCRIKSLNPHVEPIVRDFLKIAGSDGLVIFTEDMTNDEKEMAIFESLLKEGYTVEEANEEAKKRLKKINAIFNQI